MESLWAWMMILILYTLLLLSLLLLIPRRHFHTSTKLVSMASAQPPAVEACSIAVWSVGFRTRWTPVWWRRLTALPSACRDHSVSKPAMCIHVLLNTVSPASVWFVPTADNLTSTFLLLLLLIQTDNDTLSLAMSRKQVKGLCKIQQKSTNKCPVLLHCSSRVER